MPFRHPSLRSILPAAGALLIACAPAREAALPVAPPTLPESATPTPPASLEPAPSSDPDVIPALADEPDDNPYLPTNAASRPSGRLSARDPARRTP